MALFSLHCTTCRATLKVNDAGAIGKILACPRCQSMVQVVPPADWTDPTTAVAAAAVIAPAIVPPPAPPSLPIAAEVVPTAPPVAPAAVPTDWDTPVPTMNPVWAIGVSASLAVAVLAFVLWRSLPSSDEEQPVSEPAAVAQTATETPAESTSPTVAAEPQQSTQPAPAEAAPIAEATPTDTTPPADVAAGAEEPKPAAETAPAVVADPQPPPVTPPAEAPTAEQPVATAAPTAPPDLAPAKRPRKALSTHPPRLVDVSARLNDRLPRIEWNRGKLSDFLNMLSNVSTLPITVDPAALLELGIAADAPVSVSLTDTTVGRALDSALQPLGLGYGIEGNHVIVATRAGKRDATRRVRYAVSDLTGSDPASLAEFATLIHTLVTPDSWQESGGSGTIQVVGDALSIEQTGAVHYQVLALCEKLRVARGKPLRSRYAPSRFRLEPNAAAKATTQAVTLTYLTAAPVAQIVESLQKASGGCVLVDWQALEADGFSPDSEATLKVQAQPLEAALAQLVEPLELTCVPVDERTFQITTPTAATGRQSVAFYKMSDVVPRRVLAADLVHRLQIEVAPTQWNGSGASNADGAAYFDAPSGYLLVSQTPATQAQVRAWLDQLRAGK